MLENKQKIKEELIVGLVDVLVFGLVLGLVFGVAGLVFGLTTQIIAYFSSSLVFSPFDFWGLLVGLIIIQGFGWFLVWRLKEK